MNRLILMISLILLCLHSASFSQVPESPGSSFVAGPVHVSIGGSVGYGLVSMADINRLLREAGVLNRGPNSKELAAEEFTGGLYWEGSLMVRLNRLLIGVGIMVLSTSASNQFDQSFYFREDFDGKVTEFLVLAGIRLPSKTALVLDLTAGVGYGKASMDYTGTFKDFFNPANDLSIVSPLEGSYLAARITGVGRIILSPISIDVSVGYRLANPGVMKGPATINGQFYANEEPLVDRDDKEIKFNFSGPYASGGVSIEF